MTPQQHHESAEAYLHALPVTGALDDDQKALAAIAHALLARDDSQPRPEPVTAELVSGTDARGYWPVVALLLGAMAAIVAIVWLLVA